MAGNKRNALVLALVHRLAEANIPCKETHVQKFAFLLQEGMEVPLGFQFSLYKHAPFSFELSESLGELRGASLLDLNTRPYPFGYSMGVSDNGAALIRRFSRILDQYQREFDFVVRRLAVRSLVELEVLATALYVSKASAPESSDDTVTRMLKLQPHISQDAAEHAVNDVNDILEQAPSRALALA